MKTSLLSLIAFSVLASSQAFAGQLTCFYLEKNTERVIGATQIAAEIDAELNVSNLRLAHLGSAAFWENQHKKLELQDIIVNRQVLKMTAVPVNDQALYYEVEAAYRGKNLYKGTITVRRAPHFEYNHSFPVECSAYTQE